jgi:hypothetical protein
LKIGSPGPLIVCDSQCLPPGYSLSHIEYQALLIFGILRDCSRIGLSNGRWEFCNLLANLRSVVIKVANFATLLAVFSVFLTVKFMVNIPTI